MGRSFLECKTFVLLEIKPIEKLFEVYFDYGIWFNTIRTVKSRPKVQSSEECFDLAHCFAWAAGTRQQATPVENLAFFTVRRSHSSHDCTLAIERVSLQSLRIKTTFNSSLSSGYFSSYDSAARLQSELKIKTRQVTSSQNQNKW